MKFTNAALCAFLASAAMAGPAAAQSYGASSQPAKAKPAADDAATPKPSKGALKALQELQKAVDANDTAAIPAKLAAAKAAAKTADDRYVAAVLEYKAAVAAKDNARKAAALEAVLASGFTGLPPADLYVDLGDTYLALSQSGRAIEAYKRAIQLNPASVAAMARLAEALSDANRAAEAIPVLKSGIAAQERAGGKAPETWYKNVVALAAKAKLPSVVELSRDWLRAYPTSANWENVLQMFHGTTTFDDTAELDLLRLMRATGSLEKRSHYLGYADLALAKGLSGEAKAVLDEGLAANAIQRDSAEVKDLYSSANSKAAASKASLPAAPESGANGRQTLNMGDAYYGYGDYQKAAEFYRSALSKSGVDADLANLHLGMALARSGDTAGAKAAFSAVGSGIPKQLAQFWQVYLATKA